MTRNIELKTVSKILASKTSQINIGGQVPAGMKRWITFLSVDTWALASCQAVKLYLASVPTSISPRSSIVATTNRKMMIDLRASGINQGTKRNFTPDGPPLMIPDRPDSNKPLFSIAAGKWLGAYASNASAANVLIQYFDE